MRYKFYREHKYVSFRCNQVEQLVAKTDFTSAIERQKIKETFNELIMLLEGHAEYENNVLHPLLKKKNSEVFKKIEQEHKGFETEISFLRNLLESIDKSSSDEDAIERGYQFYLFFRKFVGENLIHLHEEETIILPELQRLYSDQELKRVEATIYKQMSIQEIIDMLNELFPHMNIHDQTVFLQDIYDIHPHRLKEIWEGIRHKTPDAVLQKIALHPRI